MNALAELSEEFSQKYKQYNMNILIIKFGALGDVIRTSYILPGLFKKCDNPKIYWITAPESFDLLRFNPYIYTIMTPNFNMHHLKGILFDLVISLDDEREVLKTIESIDYKELFGAYLSDNQPAYTGSASAWFNMGLISRFGKATADKLKKENTREHNEILAEMLGIEINGPIFFNSPLIEKRMSKRFNDAYFNNGINSSAGARWVSKQLSMYETITLIEKLLSLKAAGKQTCIYLLGGEEEQERHAAIKKAIASERLIDSGTDNSLLEFAAIIKHCDYVITTDSLALHLAISQKVRNLSFFAPTSSEEIGTFGTGVKIASLSDDYCSYRTDADNSTITATRLFDKMTEHLRAHSVTAIWEAKEKKN